MAKILTVYYSRKGENYWNGSIKNLEKGNTAIAAELVQKAVGGDLFEIDTVRTYDKDYYVCIEEAKAELREGARPELKAYPDNLEDYDTIFVGYPIWWSDMPMAVYTFIEANDWNGKTIIPFCTHAGSGLSSTVSAIKGLCEGAAVENGLAVSGATAQNDRGAAKSAVVNWLNSRVK